MTAAPVTRSSADLVVANARCLATVDPERRELEAHLAHCAACFGCLQSIQRTIALCKQAGPQTVPPVFSTKLQTMIQHIRNDP